MHISFKLFYSIVHNPGEKVPTWSLRAIWNLEKFPNWKDTNKISGLIISQVSTIFKTGLFQHNIVLLTYGHYSS